MKWLKLLIAALPGARLRARAYALLCGYRVGKGARVGFLALLDCKIAELGEGASISRFCRFTQIDKLTLGPRAAIERSCRFSYLAEIEIGQDTRIQSRSDFIGAPWDPAGRVARLRIGRDCLICGMMHFDLARDILIGDKTTVGGLRSAFWTHGLTWDKNLPIRIGNHCYLGGGVMIGPGSVIADECVVGMGSVLQGIFDEPDSLILGNRAQTVKRGYRRGLAEKQPPPCE